MSVVETLVKPGVAKDFRLQFDDNGIKKGVETGIFLRGSAHGQRIITFLLIGKVSLPTKRDLN